MRSLLIGVICLVFGVLGALGYSHYLGEGKQLAQLQDELTKTRSDLAKASDEGKQAKSETVAMTAQIQQLNTSKEELKKQLDEVKNTTSASNAAPVTPFAGLLAGTGMKDIIKTHRVQRDHEKLQMLISRLHLTPDQVAKIQAAMEEEGKLMEEMTAKMLAGQKFDPKNPGDTKDRVTVDKTLQDIMTPEQKTAYQQMQMDQKNSSAEMLASFEMNRVAPLLQLSDAQKDQMATALYQVQLDEQDPNWIKANVGNVATNPLAMMDAQEKAKEDALAKFLSPEQLATYRQSAQNQLETQRTMLKKFMAPGNAPTSGANPVAPAPVAPNP